MSSYQLGPFRLHEPIGEGGVGEVWRAEHTSGLPVAVKLTRAARARRRTIRDALAREARAVARLSHRHVVVLYEVGVCDRTEGPLVEGAPWLGMELAEGTLADVQLSGPELLVALDSVLSALAHAHSRGLVHRDVKPSNVLVAPGGRVVLADFGLASAVSGGVAGGTPGYMAPEQLSGGPLGPATDLYAVGTMAWALFGGRQPWEARAPGEALPPLAEGGAAIPDGLDAWIRRMTASDPADRFAFAADARAALASLDGAPMPAVVHDPATRDVPAMTLSGMVSRYLGTRPGSTVSTAPLSVARSEPVPAPTGRAPPVPETWPDTSAVVRAPRGTGLSLVSLREAPVVGREVVQRALWEGVRRIAAGRPAALALVGPPGMGKTHLARWALRVAHEAGVAVPVESVATPSGMRWEGLRPDDGDDVAALTRALRGIAGDRAVVWVLDEVHVAPRSAAIAQAVCRSSLAPPVLLLMTSDDRDAVPRDVPVHVLDPMSPRAMLELAEHAVGLRGPAADRIVEHAAGNPTRALQLVDHWVSTDVLEASAQGLALRPGADLVPPVSLDALWTDRIASLSPGARRALAAAAVVGDAVDADAWRHLDPADPEDVQALEAAGLLAPAPGGWRFVHASAHEAALAVLDDEGRRALSARLVEALADHPSVHTDRRLAVRLARAQRDAGLLDEAVRSFGTAAQLLRTSGFHGASNALLLEQRDLLEASGAAEGDEGWSGCMLQLATNAIHRHRYEEAEAWLVEAERHAAVHDDPWQQCGVHMARGELSEQQTRSAEARERYVLAQAAARRAGAPDREAYALMRQAHLLVGGGDVGGALALYAEAGSRFAAADAPPRAFLGLLVSRLHAASKQSHTAAGTVSDLDRAVALARESEERNMLATALMLRANHAVGGGDLVGAERDYAEGLDVLVAQGSGRVPMMLLHLARLRAVREQWNEARAEFLAIEDQCTGLNALFWGLMSLPCFALDVDLPDRLAAIVDRVESAALFDPEHLVVLEATAARADQAGLHVHALACRAVARRWAEKI